MVSGLLSPLGVAEWLPHAPIAADFCERGFSDTPTPMGVFVFIGPEVSRGRRMPPQAVPSNFADCAGCSVTFQL